MALTNNPNKTKSIEKKWNREISNRWAKFSAKIKLLQLNSFVTNLDDQEQNEVDIFTAEFELLALAILLGGNDGEWQTKYQDLVYERSAQRTINETKSVLTPEELTAIFLFTVVGGLLTIPANRNELAFLHTRAKDKLTGWVDVLVKEAKSIVHDNIGKLSKDEIIALLKERLDITASRARMIATTEITQSAQRAVTVQSRELASALGKEVGLRWITVGDSKVRHLHAGWHGLVFTPEEAETNMNISPWNCRCGLKTVIKNRDPARLKAKFAKERKFLLAKESKN